MKLVNYQLQTQIECLSQDKPKDFFKDYLTTILEDSVKPYFQKADYVGLSLQELKFKIDTLTSNIAELQQLKKKLSVSLEIAKEITASVLIDNGIDRIDGNIISSITLTTPTSKTKTELKILNNNEVMKLGYVKFEPDIEAIEKALLTKEGLKELTDLVSIKETTVTTPAKVKINAKRTSSNNTEIDELLIVKKAA